MATTSKSRGITRFGKRFVNQIWSGSSRNPSQFSSLPVFSLRSVHHSVYDKNPDDLLGPSVIPDDMIQPQSDKYWTPHPHTGVFGPGTEHKGHTIGERGFHTPPTYGGASDSVLEQKAWFRPLEDLEKPR